MRAYVLKSNTACLDNVNPRSPASSGRFDVVLDFVLECLFLRKSPRTDTVIYAVLDGCSPCRILKFTAADFSYKRVESENDVLRLVLERKIEVLEMGFRDFLRMLKSQGFELVCLIEDGDPIEKHIDKLCRENVAFIVGDQDGFTHEDLEVLRQEVSTFVSIGPIPYLSWFCCVYVNYLADTYCSST